MFVTVGVSAGRQFTGQHGDGELSETGLANVAGWPGMSGGVVSGWGGAAGYGYRGGSWRAGDDNYARTSFRFNQVYDSAWFRNNTRGGRAVRTAPPEAAP